MSILASKTSEELHELLRAAQDSLMSHTVLAQGALQEGGNPGAEPEWRRDQWQLASTHALVARALGDLADELRVELARRRRQERPWGWLTHAV